MGTLVNESWWATTFDGRDIEVIVATTPENVAYLSGFCSPSRALLPSTQVYVVARSDRGAEPVVVCPMGDLDIELQERQVGVAYRPYGAFFLEADTGAPPQLADRYETLTRDASASAFDALTAVLDEQAGTGKIALDEHGADPSLRQRLAERYGNRLVDGAQLLTRVRMVKNEEGIRRLSRAVEATEAGYEAAIAAATCGISEAEMARVLEQETRARGGTPIFTVIGFGERAAYPNAIPREDRPLRPGDAIRFDIGCCVDGHYSDIARTAVLGEPSADLRHAYAAILEGQERALQEMRPGTPAQTVFTTAVEATREAGLPSYRRNHVGHGIGLAVYDDPLLTADNDQVLQTGMVLELETPYYVLGILGVQVEDTVLMTETGHVLLTRTDRGLRVIDS